MIYYFLPPGFSNDRTLPAAAALATRAAAAEVDADTGAARGALLAGRGTLKMGLGCAAAGTMVAVTGAIGAATLNRGLG